MRYLAKHREARAVFLRFLEHGPEHVNRHLLSIMSLLGPLRRCCSGGALRERVSTTSHLYACYACVHLKCLDSPMMHCCDPLIPPVLFTQHTCALQSQHHTHSPGPALCAGEAALWRF